MYIKNYSTPIYLEIIYENSLIAKLAHIVN